MLTDIKVRNAKPGRYSDGRGDGLMLVVSPAGARKWVQRVKVAGKYRDLGHGSWPDVSLAQARRKAETVREQIAAGQDPLADRQQAARAARAAEGGPPKPLHTLREAMEGYIAAHGPGWRSAKTETLFRTRMQQHAAGLLDRDPASLGIEDVHGTLAPIWATKPVLAQKLRSHLEHSIEYSMAAGWRPHGFNSASWAGALRTLLAKPSKVTRGRNHPALPWQRIPDFMAALRDETGNAARCLEWAILTACRSGEARATDWAEVDIDAGVWSVPGAKTKSGRDHRVPLSPAALALARSMMAEHRTKPAKGPVFPNLATDEPFSDAALLALVKRMDVASLKASGQGWRDPNSEKVTPHGFRSSFRDWCGDTGQPRELAEAALAHAIGDATERAYARSDLFERRRVLMAAWADACDGKGMGQRSNVVRLAGVTR